MEFRDLGRAILLVVEPIDRVGRVAILVQVVLVTARDRLAPVATAADDQDFLAAATVRAVARAGCVPIDQAVVIAPEGQVTVIVRGARVAVIVLDDRVMVTAAGLVGRVMVIGPVVLGKGRIDLVKVGAVNSGGLAIDRIGRTGRTTDPIGVRIGTSGRTGETTVGPM